MLFDADGKIKRYESAEEILTEFFDLRLQYYERRRVSLLQARLAAARVHADMTANVLPCSQPTPQSPAQTNQHNQPTNPTNQPTQPTRPQDAEWEFMRASNKIRFIKAVIERTLVISGRKKAEVEAELERQGFDRMAKKGQVGCFSSVGRW